MKHYYAAQEYVYGMGDHYAVEPVFGSSAGIITGPKIVIKKFPDAKLRAAWIQNDKAHRFKLLATDKVRRQALRGEKGQYIISNVSDVPFT